MSGLPNDIEQVRNSLPTRSARLRLVSMMVLAGAVAACDHASGTGSEDPIGPDDVHIMAASRQIIRIPDSEFREVRALKTRFADFDDAFAQGWAVQATPCLDNLPTGAMGVHWLNPAFVDDKVAPLKPEIVIYEPQASGPPRFVGLEYIIPYSIRPETAPPPVLFGQEFLQNPGAQLWMMHLWIGRHNPDGILATWNPSVSCAAS
jgi:hypothetical protein